jgi:hypothetical protein
MAIPTTDYMAKFDGTNFIYIYISLLIFIIVSDTVHRYFFNFLLAMQQPKTGCCI